MGLNVIHIHIFPYHDKILQTKSIPNTELDESHSIPDMNLPRNLKHSPKQHATSLSSGSSPSSNKQVPFPRQTLIG